MASIQEQIRSAASQNASLLASLHSTDSAPSQLSQQNNYIRDLDHQISKTEKHVAGLKAKTASELKDHKKYSESTFRRFAHKASGRKNQFLEKAAREEREYFDAIQAQKTGEDELAYVKQLKAEAYITRQKYEAEVQRHDSFQRSLDQLYNSIFAGYTPEFPEEDEKEQACQASSEYCRQANQTLEQERHILFLLAETSRKLSEARHHLSSAHSASSMDMLGGGTFSSLQKRNFLERAESSISQVRMLQDQIRRLNPNIGDLGPMNVASGSIWGDVIFDNIFSDMEMHDKIKESETQLLRASQRLQDVIKEQEGREKDMVGDCQRASEGLQNARRELQMAREQAFARVMGGEQIGGDGLMASQPPSEDAPPAYSA
ncbi:uncharacterized protein BDR25DRAFT_86582 [Lindgomyces ingoldianus]|uniref:Uncharacterized protein n=1 Tax=Lindgomyces ingoldianus TaxID=673940 RepID=A0ACB6QGV9_9PLEO|nr:uncharacterized protein BDR25DRAFT_86582 [Lindgomyces ingoldianus]KAF2465381.1 hypothetical protein BDR25DRAFT_86582 [Lindgomyces ingoldianus]